MNSSDGPAAVTSDDLPEGDIIKILLDQHADIRELLDAVSEGSDEATRKSLGRDIHSVQSMAPTRPHPSAAGKPLAQWAVGPFAAIMDRARDLLSKKRSS